MVEALQETKEQTSVFVDRLVTLNEEYMRDQNSTLDSFSKPTSQLQDFQVSSTFQFKTVQPHPTDRFPNVLIMYSGPTSYVPYEPFSEKGLKAKTYIYQRNFDYFLQRLQDCVHDVVIVLTAETAPVYRFRLRQLDQKCQAANGHRVWMRVRSPDCYDMESFRVVRETVDTRRYEYFVYINCGSVGPHTSYGTNWTSVLLSGLDDRVKMTGLTVNCGCHGADRPHVQSMVFATDRAGWNLLSQVPYDCNTHTNYTSITSAEQRMVYIVRTYECQMGQVLLDAGYQLRGILQPQALTRPCAYKKDMLWPKRFRQAFGKIPTMKDMLFFKSSRMIDDQLRQELGMPEREVSLR